MDGWMDEWFDRLIDDQSIDGQTYEDMNME